MKIITEILQKMISKSIQGASNNKMIPLTSLIGIEVKNNPLKLDSGILTLITTDGSNQLRISSEVDSKEEFYSIVNAELFSKLVGKTTKEYIELNNKDNYLEFKGNGTNKFDIAINEEGQMIDFDEIPNLEAESYTIQTKLLQDLIKSAKSSVAKTMEVPCLTGYYISDMMMSTDRQLIYKANAALSKEPLLISSEMAELLLLVEDEKLNVLHKDNDLIFYTDNITISGKELEGKEMYPVKSIEGVIAQSYSTSVKVNKQELINILDRLGLFVADYDKNVVNLRFTNKSLILQSKKSTAIEELAFLEENTGKEYTCLVDITMLKSQVETISTDSVEIWYGQDKSIKIVDGNIVHIVSLAEEN